MKTVRWILVVAFALASASTGFAGEMPEMPKPTAEHKALAAFVGEWAGSGEMKPGPFGPGGPMEWTETCSWFGGAEFNVVCKSKGTGPMGPMKGLGIIGYNPEKKVYTHYGIDNHGWTGHSKGTVDGKTWTYKSKESMDGKEFHSMFTMTMESPTRMTFSWSMSEDGETWAVMMDGVSEKK